MKRWLLLLVAAAAVLAGTDAITRSLPESVLVVPIDLHEFATARGCHPPADFYQRPGVRRPPYLYADGLFSAEPAAVLWCEQQPGSGKYTLLFRAGAGDVGQGDCAAKIDNQSHIGGLSLVPATGLNLTDFRYVANPGKVGPTADTAAGVAIHSEYDGAGEEFYCHAGRWLYRVFH